MLKEADYIIYLDSLLKGDKRECIKTVDRLLDEGINVKQIYTKLLQRSMYRVGSLCEKGRLAISNERIASDITWNIIDLLYPRNIKSKNGMRILITCIDKEHHSIGARIISDYFELNGWKSTFLGSNVCCTELVNFIKKARPDVVGVSSNFYLNITRLIKLIEDIKSQNPLQEIIIGGQIFARGDEKIIKKYKNVKYISSMKKLDSYINLKGKNNGNEKIHKSSY